jgi:cytochrome c-type biogenesis protein CcmH/NrfG
MSTRLVKHQKMTKRQIKEDALVTAAFRATEVWERHGRTILVVAGAVVLVAVLILFVTRTRAQSEERAQGELYRAVLAVNQGDYVTAGPMLKELSDNSPGTRSARDAERYLAVVMVAQGRYSEAVASYRKFIDRSGGDAVATLTGSAITNTLRLTRGIAGETGATPLMTSSRFSSLLNSKKIIEF